MKKAAFVPNRILCLAVLFALGGSMLVAGGPQDEKPSTFAPMPDLAAQVEEFIEEIAEDLEDPDDYTEDHKSRIVLNSSTLIVLGQTIGMHDAEHPLKQAAPRLIEAATELSENADDFAAAGGSLAAIRESLTSTSGGDVDWEPAADLGALMRQVPIVNNSLRRGVTGRRFERMIDKSAGTASTLAAIAQASIYYTDYCLDEEDEARWAEICIDMREAATQVNVAVRRKDKPAAVAGLAKLVETCDACHHTFRD
jgi:hypothetical protein